MRIALIDLGTTSLRLEIYDCARAADNRLEIDRRHQARYMPRLGQGLYRSGRLSPEGRLLAEQYFRQIAGTIAESAVDAVAGVGTSALREAADGEDFIRRAAEILGHPLEIISGVEEARLTALGVMAFERNLPRNFAMVDIGGGSTEISVCRENRTSYSTSVPLGAIRMKNLFLPDLPARDDQLQALQAAISAALQNEAAAINSYPASELIVGTSGTIRMLCAIHQARTRGLSALDLPAVTALCAELAGKSEREIAAIEQMEANRADIILAGAIIFRETMAFLRGAKVVSSLYSLRHGLLVEAVEAMESSAR